MRVDTKDTSDEARIEVMINDLICSIMFLLPRWLTPPTICLTTCKKSTLARTITQDAFFFQKADRLLWIQKNNSG